MTTCAYCGRANEPGALFCMDCGKPLSKAPAAAKKAVPTPVPQGEEGSAVQSAAAAQGGLGHDPAGRAEASCPFCGTTVDGAHPYCPHCGRRLSAPGSGPACARCGSPVGPSARFCATCGATIDAPGGGLARPSERPAPRTEFLFRLQLQDEGGRSLENYESRRIETTIGRADGDVRFPDDPFLSPVHANFRYANNQLTVRDEGSLNGVFLRVRGTVDIDPGSEFLTGEQLFVVELPPKIADGPSSDGTYFYTSPKHQTLFRVTQILEGGAFGMSVLARTNVLQIGREGGDLNFPTDLYMSASHCKIEESGGKLTLTDLNSRNGTYLRIKDERELAHGDYLFMGRKLLRVEITAA